ncbi:hypothetical protein AB6A40_003802 [Gnathostoma spinigerum]|uniref:lysozyme n=1 Tax=Gnathostoma spinigerum TaxID=75299 RepID=A0ABD6EAL3_9BILA
MEIFKYLFIFNAHFLISVYCLLRFPQVKIKRECLLAMCKADSGCMKKGCSIDTHGRHGCGYFRLNIYHYKQCYQPGKREGQDEDEAWIACAESYECSKLCIRRLGNRFKVKCYGKSDCEAVARIHDGGANGCRSKDTLEYWNLVKQKCPHC